MSRSGTYPWVTRIMTCVLGAVCFSTSLLCQEALQFVVPGPFERGSQVISLLLSLFKFGVDFFTIHNQSAGQLIFNLL